MADRLLKYNPSLLDEEVLVKNFVVRQADLEAAREVVAENSEAGAINQHLLIIGPRGSGKTTLVHRLASAVRSDPALNAAWYPLIFSEESYEALSVGEFWLDALFHLAEQTGEEKWRRTHAELKGVAADAELRTRALGQLLDFADREGKKILLVVENLNMLLGDQISEAEAWELRHTLSNEPRLMLLGTATARFDSVENAEQAMYQQFKIQELRPLEERDCNAVWELIAGTKLDGEKIRPIRILTGGNLRLLGIIAKFGAGRSFDRLMEDLIWLVDEHTEYFRSHLDTIAALERKVYLALAELWDFAGAREVARAARLDINRTSALLNRLVGRGAVQATSTSRRAKLYSVSERMFNIYYLMRRRGKPADRVTAAVKFMIAMYGHAPAAEMIALDAMRIGLEKSSQHRFALLKIVKECRDPELRKAIQEMMPEDWRTPEEDDFADSPADDGGGPEDAEGTDERDLAGEYGRYFSRYCDDTIASVQDDPFPALFFSKILREDGGTDTTREKLAEICQKSSSSYTQAMRAALSALFLENGNSENRAENLSLLETIIKFGQDIDEQDFRNTILLMTLFEKLDFFDKDDAKEGVKDLLERVDACVGREDNLAVKNALALIMGSMGETLAQYELFQDAIAVYDLAIARYGNTPELGKTVAAIYSDKIEALNELGESDAAEELLQHALVLHPKSSDLNHRLIVAMLGNSEERAEAIRVAEEWIHSNPDDKSFLHGAAYAIYRAGLATEFAECEEWARRAVVNDEDEKADYQHTLACVLAARGKIDEALTMAREWVADKRFLNDTIRKALIDQAIELFVEIAAAGSAKEAVAILEASPAIRHLEPLAAGLRLDLGEEIRSPVEIREVAKDVAARIEARRKKRADARSRS